jgi:hypothetical protein
MTALSGWKAKMLLRLADRPAVVVQETRARRAFAARRLVILSTPLQECIVTTTNIPASKPSCCDDDRSSCGAASEIPEVPTDQPVPRPERTSRNPRASWHFELFLAFCSSWVAVQLWFWPDRVPVGNTLVTLSDGLRGRGETWALICALAALLKLSGLACRFWTPWTGVSTVLMITGLFMSIVIWTIVGATWEFEFPHSLTPIILIGGALGAAWQLAKWKPRLGPRP